VDHDKDRKEHKNHTTNPPPPDSPSWKNIARELPQLPHATNLHQIKAELHFFPVFLSLPLNRQDEFCASKLAHTRSSLARSLARLSAGRQQTTLSGARPGDAVGRETANGQLWMDE